MKALLSALSNKYFLYAVIVIVVLGFLQYGSCNFKKHNAELETYKRQLSGQLTEKEKELVRS